MWMLFGVNPMMGFFFLFFLLPLIVRLMRSMTHGINAGPSASRPILEPFSGTNTVASGAGFQLFENTKREFPSKLIDLDNELTLAEQLVADTEIAGGSDLDSGELASARKHLNLAFAQYSKMFAGEASDVGDIDQAHHSLSSDFTFAKRHLALASPLTASSAPDAPGALVRQPTTAPVPAMFGGFGGFSGFGSPVTMQPVTAQRRTQVAFTPFGLTIFTD
jgi:hypothetical protein